MSKITPPLCTRAFLSLFHFVGLTCFQSIEKPEMSAFGFRIIISITEILCWGFSLYKNGTRFVVCSYFFRMLVCIDNCFAFGVSQTEMAVVEYFLEWWLYSTLLIVTVPFWTAQQNKLHKNKEHIEVSTSPGKLYVLQVLYTFIRATYRNDVGTWCFERLVGLTLSYSFINLQVLYFQIRHWVRPIYKFLHVNMVRELTRLTDTKGIKIKSSVNDKRSAIIYLLFLSRFAKAIQLFSRCDEPPDFSLPPLPPVAFFSK